MNQNPDNTAAAPFTGGAAGASVKMKPKKKALEFIAVEMEKKDLLFATRHKPELFSIGMRACIYCGQRCNGGKIPNAREIFESTDTARVTAMFYIDADEARQVLKDEPGFWHWKGDTLHIDLYPLMYEKKTLEFRAKQAGNRKSGWDKKRNQVTAANAAASPTVNRNIPHDLPDYLADYTNEN